MGWIAMDMLVTLKCEYRGIAMASSIYQPMWLVGHAAGLQVRMIHYSTTHAGSGWQTHARSEVMKTSTFQQDGSDSNINSDQSSAKPV